MAADVLSPDTDSLSSGIILAIYNQQVFLF